MPSALLVTQDLQLAGAQRQCVELALGLARKPGWKVEVAVLKPDGPLAAELRAAQVPLHSCPRRWRWDLSPARQIASLCRSNQYDLVHSFLFLPNFYARIAGLLQRPPVLISSLRSTGIAGWPRYVAEILMAPLCDAIIANSIAGRDDLRRRGVSDHRMVVIQNGLDLARFQGRRGERMRGESSNGAGCIGMIAQMEARKDHLTLLQAFKLVRAEYPSVRLLLAGSGSRRVRIERYIHENGLADSAQLLGTVAEPEHVYPLLDIYVQASASEEGTSNSIIEAMATGLPVVASDVGGNREVVVDGETGRIVPAEDVAALARAIVWLLKNPGLARQMGEAGAARAAALYTRERMVQATVDVYERLLSVASVARQPHGYERTRSCGGR